MTRDHIESVRLTADELEELSFDARRAGVSLSALIRYRLFHARRRDDASTPTPRGSLAELVGLNGPIEGAGR